jgi:flagellar secretion chaperone FliS
MHSPSPTTTHSITMFSAARSSFGPAQSFASAYRQVGVETGVHSASPHQLVMMLFDGYMDALTQAQGAMKAGQIEAKGKAIGRAVRIIEEGLKASLDLGRGGELAGSMHDLYSYTIVRLTKANLHNDAAALEECRTLIEPLRSAWKSIGSEVNGARS